MLVEEPKECVFFFFWKDISEFATSNVPEVTCSLCVIFSECLPLFFFLFVTTFIYGSPHFPPCFSLVLFLKKILKNF